MKKFLYLNTWKQIFKSRLLYFKYRNESWAIGRKEICNDCEHNSKNKLKNWFARFYPWCTVCYCPIKFKVVEPSSVCGLVEKDEEPKWVSVYIPNKAQKKKWNMK